MKGQCHARKLLLRRGLRKGALPEYIGTAAEAQHRDNMVLEKQKGEAVRWKNSSKLNVCKLGVLNSIATLTVMQYRGGNKCSAERIVTAESPTESHRKTVTRAWAEGIPFSPTFLAAIATHLHKSQRQAATSEVRHKTIRTNPLTFHNIKDKRASGRFAIDGNRTTKEQRSSGKQQCQAGIYVLT